MSWFIKVRVILLEKMEKGIQSIALQWGLMPLVMTTCILKAMKEINFVWNSKSCCTTIAAKLNSPTSWTLLHTMYLLVIFLLCFTYSCGRFMKLCRVRRALIYLYTWLLCFTLCLGCIFNGPRQLQSVSRVVVWCNVSRSSVMTF